MALKSDDFLSTAGDILQGVGEDSFLLALGEILDRQTSLGMFQTQVIDLTNGSAGETVFSRGYAMAVVGEYERWVMANDPRVPAIATDPGAFKPGWAWIDEEAFDRSEVVRGWLDRPDIDMRWGAAGLLPVGDDRALVLAALRPRHEGPHEIAETAPLNALAPFIARAVGLHERLIESRSAGRAIVTAMRDEAVAVLDRQRRILVANARAETLLSSGTIKTRRDGSLEFSERRAQAGFDLAMDVARSPAGLTRPERPFPVAIDGESGIAKVSAFAELALGAGFPARAIAVLTIAGLHDRSVPRFNLQSFGLSPRESELACALAGGETLADYAEHRRLSIETVRSHLKHAMSKLGVRRQVDLVRLVLRIS